MSDLDLGMNDWTTEPFRWDDARCYDRGKRLDADGLEQMKDWGRYLDVDGDGIPWRTIPATHPDRGAYLVRGTSHDEYARYTEDGEVYLRSMERLARKFQTAARLVPSAEATPSANDTLLGVVYFGTTTAAMEEALEALHADGVEIDALRIRAFPFGPEVYDFIARHATVFVVEQNRDAQMRTLLVNEGDIDPASLVLRAALRRIANHEHVHRGCGSRASRAGREGARSPPAPPGSRLSGSSRPSRLKGHEPITHVLRGRRSTASRRTCAGRARALPTPARPPARTPVRTPPTGTEPDETVPHDPHRQAPLQPPASRH